MEESKEAGSFEKVALFYAPCCNSRVVGLERSAIHQRRWIWRHMSVVE